MPSTSPPPPPGPRQGNSATPWVVGAVVVLLIAGVTVAGILLAVERHRQAAASASAPANERRAQPAVAQPDYATIERVASQSTVALLSYEPDTVRQSLTKATDLLTGAFRDSFTTLINDVVIPGAEKQRIMAKASVPAVGVAEADDASATALVFIDQTVVTGSAAPNQTASSVRMHLVKVDDRWLIDRFEPL